MPIFPSSYNPAPLPTLSPSFHNNLKKHHSKTSSNQDFKTISQLNLSKTSFNKTFITISKNHHSKTSFNKNFITISQLNLSKLSFQNSLNNNNNTNHFEDVSQHSNLQKDFEQVTYITKNHHQPNTGKVLLRI